MPQELTFAILAQSPIKGCDPDAPETATGWSRARDGASPVLSLRCRDSDGRLVVLAQHPQVPTTQVPSQDLCAARSLPRPLHGFRQPL